MQNESLSMEQKKEEQRLDEISDLLILMFHNGWWKDSVRRQAANVLTIRDSLLPMVNMRAPGPCDECQGWVTHRCRLVNLKEFSIFCPEVQEPIMKFFETRDKECTGDDAKECAKYRRKIDEFFTEMHIKYSSEVKEWERKYGELDRAWDRLKRVMEDGGIDDDFRRDKDSLTNGDVFSKWMIFAQTRRILHLRDRILNDEVPGKRKSDEGEETIKESRVSEGMMMGKRKLDEEDE